jgi:hypothetical protein
MSMITEDVPLCSMRGVAHTVVAHQSLKSSPAMGRVELVHIQDSTSGQIALVKGKHVRMCVNVSFDWLLWGMATFDVRADHPSNVYDAWQPSVVHDFHLRF